MIGHPSFKLCGGNVSRESVGYWVVEFKRKIYRYVFAESQTSLSIMWFSKNRRVFSKSPRCWRDDHLSSDTRSVRSQACCALCFAGEMWALEEWSEDSVVPALSFLVLSVRIKLMFHFSTFSRGGAK